MTSYEIKVQECDGETYYQPLSATTDAAALREMTERVKHYERNIRVFLAWQRDSDGCRGFLNSDGSASATGKAWCDGVTPLRVKY